MTLFDADKGKKAVSDEVETKSHEFAALFADLPPRKQRIVLNKMNELLDDPDSVDAFAAGTYAQDSSGAPAKALGGGTPGTASTDAKQQLADALGNYGASTGQMQAILRILNAPGDPGHIEVESDGTPSELKSTRTQRDAEKTAKEKAETELANERDDSKSGSLAEQLKKAKATPAAPADSVKKTEVKAKVDDIDAAVAHLSAPMGAKVKGKAEVIAAVEELKQLC